MAKDVHSALERVLQKYLASREAQDRTSTPQKLLEKLKEEGRYLVDAWS